MIVSVAANERGWLQMYDGNAFDVEVSPATLCYIDSFENEFRV